ncbi:uncharacterized protein LOC26527562 isoform X2 [Drosophila mojavensis]|uniref:uncharacterized protein LOC26527562 isoform X2 n=1 Tax=Drosophila mojavensis TaxID=7230 RepID=UPI001CD12F56|nr:uncharacterized protein LOC26527562 isoform X2 [Drosophila mojavensis]
MTASASSVSSDDSYDHLMTYIQKRACKLKRMKKKKKKKPLGTIFYTGFAIIYRDLHIYCYYCSPPMRTITRSAPQNLYRFNMPLGLISSFDRGRAGPGSGSDHKAEWQQKTHKLHANNYPKEIQQQVSMRCESRQVV